MNQTILGSTEEFAKTAYAEESQADQHPVGSSQELPSISTSSTNLPYISTTSTVSIDQHIIRDYGILSKEKSSDVQDFQPWGSKNLTLHRIEKENGVSLNAIRGFTSESAGGFTLDNVNFQDRFVLILLGDVQKSRPSQLSFTFALEAGDTEYNLIFVHGPLYVEGWKGSNYYEQIEPYSSRLLDLKDLLGSKVTTYSLKKIVVVLQKDVSISAEFSIDLARTSKNNIIRNDGILLYDQYIFNNLGFNRLITLEFTSSEPVDNLSVVENGWEILSVKDTKNERLGTTAIMLTAKQPTSESVPELLAHLDIIQSIITLGTKDWLLILISLVSILIYPDIQLFGRKL